MKKTIKSIAFVLALTMGLLLPLSANAQYYKGSLLNDDPTARWQQQDGLMNNRNIVTWTEANGIFNNGIGQSEVPVGSGLLILSAAGLGYTLARRKRSRKGTALLMAGVLLLGFTQCKKEEPLEPAQGEKVHITLTVGGGASTSSATNDGVKADVEPTGGGTFATVTFEDDDILYVVNGGQYCGTLTCTYSGDDYVFSGDITPTSTDDYLHFYLLGGKDFTATVTDNTATVNISDQTSKYPVISYAPSTEKYSTSITEYSAKLLNYCSIMKFTTNNEDDINSQVLCITGMNNKVTVDFTKAASELEADNHGFSFSVDGTDGGLIKMPTSTDGTRWAIVLPQTALSEGAAGSIYTADEYFKGSRPELAKIDRNSYLYGGISLSMVRQGFDLADASYDGAANTVAHIYQSNSGTATANTITIADGQTVYLHGVNMLVNGNAINCLGNAEIVLCGTNTINSQYSDLGDNNKAIIKAGTYEPMTTLTISGSGSLEVRTKYTGSWMGAFIGSDKNGECGNISITGGTITAIAYPKPGATEYNNSAAYGACIGAGSANSGTSRCGDITISGGTVTVDTHKGGGAGIGSGTSENANGYSSCGKITISGGRVNATANQGGAGIGSGRVGIVSNNVTYNGYSLCEGIIIEGTAYVTAYSSSSSGQNDYAGAAIGTGNSGQIGYITISNGTVTATQTGYYAPGIGAGRFKSNCGNITISRGTVTASGGYEAAGIGTGNGYNLRVSTCNDITITTGVTKVTATKGANGYKSIGQGKAAYTKCGTITIGGTVYSDGISDSPYTYQP